MSELATLPLGCRCGQVTAVVQVPASSLPLPLMFCHCNTCSLVTGQLCATVCEIPDGSGPVQVKGNITGYKTSKAMERFFCGTCGSSIYEDASTVKVIDSGSLTVSQVSVAGKQIPVLETGQHIFVKDAKDGGLRDWMRDIPTWEGWTNSSTLVPSETIIGHPEPNEGRHLTATEELHCACKCGGVDFTISRPSQGSAHWSSPQLSEVAACPLPLNQDEDWWKPAGGYKYHAFMCACNDCRISTGFEVSAWAVIPRNNFKVTNQQQVSPENVRNFQAQSTMRDHESSPGCHRQFCGTCGATLSYFTEKMPNVINVSVGIMKSSQGVRAGDWLEWNTTGVGHEDTAQNKDIVNMLSRGIRSWAPPAGAGA